VKKGYRGWDHNDYVADDRKGDDEDRDVDCAARLDNILQALEEEKTICEDVMNSACQIRMFVNAPKAYANRKYQNRVGNSKRGRPKDIDEEPAGRPSKMKRTPLRPTTRARAISHLSSRSVNQTPDATQHQPQAQPYLTPPTQTVASPNTMPTGNFTSRHSTTLLPAQPPSFTVNRMDFASPPSLRNSLRHANTTAHAQHSSSPQHQIPVSGLPEARRPTQVIQPPEVPLETWSSMQAYDRRHGITISNTEPLFGHDWILNSGDQPNVESTNLFEQHPDAVSLGLSHEPQEFGGHDFFQGDWFAEQDTIPFTEHQDHDDIKYDRGE